MDIKLLVEAGRVLPPGYEKITQDLMKSLYAEMEKGPVPIPRLSYDAGRYAYNKKASGEQPQLDYRMTPRMFTSEEPTFNEQHVVAGTKIANALASGRDIKHLEVHNALRAGKHGDPKITGSKVESIVRHLINYARTKEPKNESIASFKQFFEEGEVVEFPSSPEDTPTIKHLRNFYGAHDPQKHPNKSDKHAEWRLEPHYSDKMWNVESDNFSAYASANPNHHTDTVQEISNLIKRHGGAVTEVVRGNQLQPERHTTSLLFVDRNSKVSHVRVVSHDMRSRGLGWRHEIHVTQNYSDVNESRIR